MEIPVLLYHDVGSAPASRSARRFRVSPSLLDEHIAALTDRGYCIRLASDIPGLAHAGATAPTAVLTFDDAFTSFLDAAAPVLDRHGVRASLFVPTAYVGSYAAWMAPEERRHHAIASWEDLRAVAAAGHEVASHGHAHRDLDTMTPALLHEDLRRSRRLLEDAVGRPVTSLAYPFGYHTKRVRTAARHAGYAVGCQVGYDVHAAGADVWQVRRLLVGPDLSPEGLLSRIEGGGPTLVERGRRLSRFPWRMARRARTVQARAAA